MTMSRNVFEKFVGATQVNKTQVRKSLQTLQVYSDERGITGNNNVHLDNESVPSKKRLSVVNKVIAAEKENAPFLRRSKRTTALTGLLNFAESPDDPSTRKSVSTKTKKNVLKPKNGRQTTLKKNKREIDSNQKKLNFSPVTSVLNKSSAVSESVHTDKSILGTSAPSEAKVTEESGINLTNGDSTQRTGSQRERLLQASQTGPSTEQNSQKEIPEPRLKEFRKILCKLFMERHAQSVPMTEIVDFMAAQKLKEPFTPEEINVALDKMDEANQVMVANDIVYLI